MRHGCAGRIRPWPARMTEHRDPQRGGPQFIPRPELWLPGRPAPWSTLAETPKVDREVVRGAFPREQKGTPSPVERDGASPSAVLVPLFDDDDGDLKLVLTRRSWELRTHRGEVSFPGGRVESGETPAQAALREAWEEVDLDRDSVELLGELDHLTTVTRRAYIVPVVGLLAEPPRLTPNPSEVDEVLVVPVSELMAPEVFREERWGTEELSRPIYFFELFGDTVWGATAAVLRQMLSRLVGVDAGTDIDLDPARHLEPGFRFDPGGYGEVV